MRTSIVNYLQVLFETILSQTQRPTEIYWDTILALYWTSKNDGSLETVKKERERERKIQRFISGIPCMCFISDQSMSVFGFLMRGEHTGYCCSQSNCDPRFTVNSESPTKMRPQSLPLFVWSFSHFPVFVVKIKRAQNSTWCVQHVISDQTHNSHLRSKDQVQITFYK